MYLFFLQFIQILREEYPDSYKETILNFEKLRILLKDDSWIEIFYPIEQKFSFHYQKGKDLYRIDTAPHHKNISTYPNHFHFKTESNVLPDTILSLSNTPANNFRAFLNWIIEFNK